MTAAGIIFSNLHDSSVPELTRTRTIASVPFGGKYRLIDFALSNMVNSGINKIGIITHYNYRSLLDHIGNGKDWDLARRSGGIKILPPFITAYDSTSASKLYTTRLEALLGARSFVERCNEDYIVSSDCDAVCNIDLSEVLRFHESSNADITVIAKRLAPSKYELNAQNQVLTYGKNADLEAVMDYVPHFETELNISTNVMVFKRSFLVNALIDASARGYTSFYKDVVSKSIGNAIVKVYSYSGAYFPVSSLNAYYECNMNLLRSDVRSSLLCENSRPILTKVRNSPPTRYTSDARVKNSLIADGCVIEGSVENAVIFRGVRVGRGTIVRNSILMQDTYVGSDVALNCVITDKNVLVKDGNILSGNKSMPFFIGKGVSV